jgi:hypothetical protein
MPTMHVTPSDSRQRPTVSIAWMYVLAGLGIVFACVTAVTLIVVTRPQTDNTAIVVTIIGFGATMMTAITAAIKAQEAKHVAKETAYRVDGRLGDLLDAMAKQKKLEGIIEGVGAATVAQHTAAPPTNGTIPYP